MVKKVILRICHKFLGNNDGYDLDIQDLVYNLSKDFEQYVLFFFEKRMIFNFIKEKKLIKIDKHIYYCQKRDIKLVIIPLEKIKGPLINSFFYKKNLNYFKGICSNIFHKIDPDIIHIHGTVLPQFIVVARLAKLNKKRLVVTNHIGKINMNTRNQYLKIKLKKYIIHNRLSLLANKVICVSKHSKDSFFFKKNVEILHSFERLSKPSCSYSEIEEIVLKNNHFQIKPSLKESNIILSYPARYCVQKNQLILTKVMKSLKNTKIKLILMGGISNLRYYNLIKKDIKNKKLTNQIYLLNHLHKEDVYKIISRSNFLIFPSINEGLGRSGIEALYMKIPILASNDSGHKEYVVEGVNGFLFDPLNYISIKKAIIKGMRKKRYLDPDFNLIDYETYIDKMKIIYEPPTMNLGTPKFQA